MFSISQFKKDAIIQRRIQNFRANKRAFVSFWIFLALCLVAGMAELVANDRPLLILSQDKVYVPFLKTYSETTFGGTYPTEADYHDPYVQCLIRTDGHQNCLQDDTQEGSGKMIWAPVRYKYDTLDKKAGMALSPPSARHWLGTDKSTRDVFARALYGFRITIFFAFLVSSTAALISITLGAIMGFFGGKVDLFVQRFVEIWSTLPTLYVIIILSSFFDFHFFSLVLVVILFSWTGLVGLVRAEFLRARNFEYVRAAKAMGVKSRTIIRRHVLPNAMIATITFMPFLVTAAIGTLATLDFLGFGLPANYPSLGDMAREARTEIKGWWLIWTAFFSYALLLSLLIFIFEGVRDAFDPRKVYA